MHSDEENDEAANQPWWRLLIGLIVSPERTARSQSKVYLIAIPLLIMVVLAGRLLQARYTDWESVVRSQLAGSGYVLQEPEIKRTAQTAQRLSVVSAVAGVIQEVVVFLAGVALCWLLLRLMREGIPFERTMRIVLIGCFPSALMSYALSATGIAYSGRYDPTAPISSVPSNAASWVNFADQSALSITLSYLDVFVIWALMLSVVLLHRVAGVRVDKAVFATVIPVALAATFQIMTFLWKRG